MSTERNEIVNFSLTITFDDFDTHGIIKKLSTVHETMGNVFSYVVYSKPNGWLVKYNLSNIDEYNTLTPDACVSMIYTICAAARYLHKPNKIVGYQQAELSVLIKAFENLICKLTHRAYLEWSQIGYDDLKQICYLTFCKLYNRGYYIHKSILEKSFSRDILLVLRKDKNKPQIVSIDTKISEDDNVTIGDCIPDVSIEEDRVQKENADVNRQIFEEMKSIIVDYMGPRQYDQLLREYSNKSTSAWGRKKMIELKAYLFDLGISIKSFNRYYGD